MSTAYALLYRALRGDGMWRATIAATFFYAAFAPQIYWAILRMRDGAGDPRAGRHAAPGSRRGPDGPRQRGAGRMEPEPHGAGRLRGDRRSPGGALAGFLLTPGRRSRSRWAAVSAVRGLCGAALSTVLVVIPSAVFVRESLGSSAHQLAVPAVRLDPSAAARYRLLPPFRDAVPVLTYHNLADSGGRNAVSPQEFARHLAMLRAAGFSSITAVQFEHFLRHRPASRKADPDHVRRRRVLDLARSRSDSQALQDERGAVRHHLGDRPSRAVLPVVARIARSPRLRPLGARGAHRRRPRNRARGSAA